MPLIFNGSAPVGGYHWAIVPDQSLRWSILDSEEWGLIVDLEDDPAAFRTTSCSRPAAEIVDSFVFSYAVRDDRLGRGSADRVEPSFRG